MSYNIGRLLYQLPQQLKLYYRKYESIYRKKINKLWVLNFNKTCINENLWPTFTKILLKNQLGQVDSVNVYE